MSNENAQNKEWLSSADTTKLLESSPALEKIRQASALRIYFRNAFPSKDYKAALEWRNAVAFTPAGNEIIKMCELKSSTEQDCADTAMTIFGLMYHHELLIDFEKTNLDTIKAILNREMLSGRLLWPHRFGRRLYDKFNDDYTGDRTDHLLPEESWQLIHDTVQGVYQVGSFISGPLGLIEVSHRRYVPPIRDYLLWHCSDPGCKSAHGVRLMPFEVDVVKMTSESRKLLTDNLGPVSEWQTPLADLVGRDVPRQPFTYYDISCLISDCIVETERCSLLVLALSGKHGQSLRDILSRPPRKKASGQGAPEVLAKSLNSEQQLQLLMALPTPDLVEIIDRCIGSGVIQMSLSEIRESENSPPVRNRTSTCEMSTSGVRCSGREPLLDFWALLWDAYSSSNRVSELDWRLRNRIGSSPQNALLDFLCQNNPDIVVKQLILASEPITKIICEKVCCSLDDITGEKFVDKLLWKLGFDAPRFSDTLTILRRRLEAFNQELLSLASLETERDREKVRSVGVNLFVSIEEILDYLVSYNVWVLASDHFLETEFKFDIQSARQIVAKVLGQTIGSGDDEARWNSNRTNTLGVLMSYLSAVAVWIKDLPAQKRDSLARNEEDMPHFADYELRIFPFKHTALWADCDYGSLGRHADVFASISTKIAQSNLAAIRNGLDHHREAAGFPKISDMLAFAARLREAIDIADVNRLFPKEFWLEHTKQDRFGREEFVFKDYLERQHVFYGPTFVHGLPGVAVDTPAIIAPGNLLGYANAEVVFTPRQKSVYSEYWSGYPRRRIIPSPSKAEAKPDVTQPENKPETKTN